MPSTAFKLLLIGALLLASATALAAPQIIESGVARVNLLELYTSEGCSSCPPAEGWFSTLTDDKHLWRQLVPVAFHVDYWDNLGWRDPFDSHVYSERQQRLANRVGDGVIYTPEFVLDGKPWANWFNLRSLRLPDAMDAGRLTLIVDGARITASFIPVNADYKYLELHMAILAFGVNTKVAAGENAGRTLRQDFLVIGYEQQPLAATASGFTAAATLPQSIHVKASRYALAAWVSVPGNPAPIQSTGDWLAAIP